VPSLFADVAKTLQHYPIYTCKFRAKFTGAFSGITFCRRKSLHFKELREKRFFRFARFGEKHLFFNRVKCVVLEHVLHFFAKIALF